MSCKTFVNTGVRDCQFALQTSKRFALVPLLDAANDAVTMATESAVTLSAMLALINADLMANRIFPLPPHDNVTDERGETEFIEFDSGAQEFGKDGTRTIEFFLPSKDGANPDLLGKLNQFTGQKFGLWIWDLDGNFSYIKGETGALVTPYEVDTFRARWVSKRYTDQASGIMVKLTLAEIVDDADIRVIVRKGHATLDFDGRDTRVIRGLRDVTITEVSNILTELVVTVIETAFPANPLTGYNAVTDWYLYNSTAGTLAEIVPSGVVETVGTPGEYTLTFSAVTEADTYTLNLVATEGFDPEDKLSGTLNAP